MNEQRLTPEDLKKVKKYFGLELDDLSDDKLAQLKKEARKKYHPDNFAHLDDEVVMDMAKERFQEIETLSGKIEHFLASGKTVAELMDSPQSADWTPPVEYAHEGMKIDIMTSDKSLKYKLFRTRVIYRGDTVGIPETNAQFISLQSFSGDINMGFRENIKVLLRFGPEDSIYTIVAWLFQRISGRTSSFVIEGKVVKIDPSEIIKAIKKESIREIGPG